jgi:hypothetical protein
LCRTVSALANPFYRVPSNVSFSAPASLLSPKTPALPPVVRIFTSSASGSTMDETHCKNLPHAMLAWSSVSLLNEQIKGPHGDLS